MSIQHTPGPWHDDGYRIYAPTEAEDKRDGRIIVEYKYIDDFNPADRYLITAAPDLLKALKSYRSALAGFFIQHDPRIPQYENLSLAVDFGNAAIAKAEGQAVPS